MLTKKELLWRLEYFNEQDKYGKVFIPNKIFGLLTQKGVFATEVKDRTTGEKVLREMKAPHVAEAYCFTFLFAWIYRNAKYGEMDYKYTTTGALKEIIGYSADNKTLNYIIKDGGVLDNLGLTRTENFYYAPTDYEINDEGFLEFFTFEDRDSWKHPNQIEDEKKDGLRPNFGVRTFKYPVFGLESEDGEYGEGTFFGFIENTHFIDFEIFVECMTNPNLGCTAFYLYGFLSHKCDVAGGQIEIGGDTITKQTGVKQRTREKALDALKKHNLVTCYPAPYIVGAGKGEGANVYSVNGIKDFTSTPKTYVKRRLLSKEQQEKKEDFINDIERFYVEVMANN
jgi:hypothetical protein